MPKNKGRTLLSRRTEEYLERIYDLVQLKGYARSKDVAGALNVSAPSVNEMFEKMDRMELVEHRKYEGVTLTDRGMTIDRNLTRKHEMVQDFLNTISVPKEIANKDACIMEPDLDPKTLE